MYKASINEFSFDIELENGVTKNGKQSQVEFLETGKQSFLMHINGTTKEADLVKLDKENKWVILRIEGKKYKVQLKEPIDILLDQLGMNQQTGKKMNHLKAPMPGLVVKVLASKGDTIKSGDPLLILEAMKMENVFKAATDVTIKEIQISEKQTVEKGQVLMLFE